MSSFKWKSFPSTLDFFIFIPHHGVRKCNLFTTPVLIYNSNCRANIKFTFIRMACRNVIEF